MEEKQQQSVEFEGCFRGTISSAGKVSLPEVFDEQLQGKYILSIFNTELNAPERTVNSLKIYPIEYFEKIIKKIFDYEDIFAYIRMPKAERDNFRMICANTYSVTGEHGDYTYPFAQLKKFGEFLPENPQPVVFWGKGRYIELWPEHAFVKEHPEISPQGRKPRGRK